jgi:ornithine decarboxylase
MFYQSNTSACPESFLVANVPDVPTLFLAPRSLADQANVFREGFRGLVTYAVKANPDKLVLSTLTLAGIKAFDVASPTEIDLVKQINPNAALHYNNPIRSRLEIEYALQNGIRSFSVDSTTELLKLYDLGAQGSEVSIRLKLPVTGAAYDFGDKFGATPKECVSLLKHSRELGFRTSMTFHPGTQCQDPNAWVRYIETVSEIVSKSGVDIERLNVGGGFPSRRSNAPVDLEGYFAIIHKAIDKHFPKNPPDLVCEPGRALVADSGALAVRIKAITDDGTIFLNDGVYGGLTEFRDVDICERITTISPDGIKRSAPQGQARVFGPTCDSIDVLPDQFRLPQDVKEDDFVIIQGMGAYVRAITTPFNGYGQFFDVSVEKLSN